MAGYFTVVTDYGIAEMLKAVNDGTKVNVSEFAAGDGGGAACVPSAAQTGLVREVWRGAVGACRISGDSGNMLVVESVMPSSVGGFTIREMGIFDDKGGMVAVCNTPDIRKGSVSDGVVQEMSLSMEMLLSNAEGVQLVVEPNVVVAMKKDVNELADQVAELRTGMEGQQNTIAEQQNIIEEQRNAIAELWTAIEALQTAVNAINDELDPMTQAQYNTLTNKTDRMYFVKG